MPDELARPHVVSPQTILWGVWLRRVLHGPWKERSLIEHMARQPLLSLPPRHVRRKVLLAFPPGFHTSYRYERVRKLLPSLQDTFRAALDTFRPGWPPSLLPNDPCANATCVVHYRVGDLATIGAPLPDAVAEAATDFDPAPRCFILLNGGANHYCKPGQRLQEDHLAQRAATSDCGASRSQQLVEELRQRFPQAEIRHESGSADDDFLRAVRAPMLLTGVGSFAMHMAIAARGQVRTPACDMHYCERRTPFDTRRRRMTRTWHLYPPVLRTPRDIGKIARHPNGTFY